MDTTLSEADYNAIADRIYIEGWALALTFGAVDQGLQHSWWPAAVCAALSAFCQFVVIRWAAWIKGHPNNPLLLSLNKIATDAKWWIVTGFVFLGYLALSPYVEQQRWPIISWFVSSPVPSSETKTRWLDLDDAERWRFSYELRSTTVAGNGARLSCPFVINISSDPQWRPEQSAEGVWSELQPLLELAWWQASAGQAQGHHPHYSAGLTIRVADQNGDAFICATNLERTLRDMKILNPSIITDPTPDLTACKNECVELDFGAIDAH